MTALLTHALLSSGSHPPIAGHTMHLMQAAAFQAHVANTLSNAAQLRYENVPIHEIATQLGTIHVELAHLIASWCNQSAPHVLSAGAVAESYSRDFKKVYPASFVPDLLTGPVTQVSQSTVASFTLMWPAATSFSASEYKYS